MNFVSLLFVGFFTITLLIFYVLPATWRRSFLLLVSYIFYATWSLPFIGLLIFTTTVDYWMSQIIARNTRKAIRLTALITGLSVNLLILGFFKYSNFLLTTSYGLAHYFGASLSLPQSLQLILPLGISFYTFEAISYMVDVYRGDKPAPNWLSYNFYIMYFPHLISGPIIRFKELFSQVQKPLQAPSLERVAKGFELLLLGYCFKVLIADRVAPLSDLVFQNPHQGSVSAIYLGVLAFTLQIYFDFMGYTHIARGASLLMNIEMPLNFNHPYNAANISDFWERWHISLSRWIRDYLYFPLGGSRGTVVRTLANLMVTMFLCGLWHGAGWMFMIWGVYHGLLLCLYHGFKLFKKSIENEALAKLYHGLSVTITFVLVCLGWVFFRSPDIKTAALVFQRLADWPAFLSENGHLIRHSHLEQPLALISLLVLCFIGPKAVEFLKQIYESLPYWGKVQIASLIVLACWILSAQSNQPFIYFQF
jgi:alginate O-acetyltransferase complex protein AlgI